MSAENGYYSELRELQQNLNENYTEFNLCEGTGDCCEPNLFILNQDMEVIKSGVKQGDIPLDVVQRAKERARDPNLTNCSFLSNDNRCTIYPFRPLVCMYYGYGGYPHTGKNIDEEKREAIQRGEFELGETIPNTELGVFACEGCGVNKCGDKKIPLEVVQLATLTREAISVLLEHESLYDSMKNFINNDL